MGNAYYTVIKEDNNRPYPHYEFQIKWNVDNIAGYTNANGFIVQLVNIDNNIKGLTGIEEKPYYEAWKVDNGICSPKSIYDDCFGLTWLNLGEDVIGGKLRSSLGSKGHIKYKARVYWINEDSPLYQPISAWKCSVIAANELPSIYAKDCILFDKIKPVFVRDTFKHKVDFRNEAIILRELNNLYSEIPTDASIYEFAKYVLHDTQYEHLLEYFK